MVMGYGANYADVISFEALEVIVPQEIQEFQAAMDAVTDAVDGVDPHTFIGVAQVRDRVEDSPGTGSLDPAREAFIRAAIEEWEEAADEFYPLLREFYDKYLALSAAFTTATRVGDSELELYLGYHDSQAQGSAYDDVEEFFFHVDGMYQLSPAGAAIQDQVTRSFFVTYG